METGEYEIDQDELAALKRAKAKRLETFQQAFSYKDPAQNDQLLAALRKAGLE